MAKFITIFHIIFLLIQIILLRNTSAYLDEITTTIIDKNGVEIELNWIKTKQFLANENLPVWRARTTSAYLRKDEEVMTNIGNFETYYDLDKSSAVIYLEKENSIYGIIGMRYELIGLPVEKLDEKHIVGESRWVIDVGEDTPVDSSELTLDHADTSLIDENKLLISPSTSHSSSSKRPHTDDGDGCVNSDSPLTKRQRIDFELSSISRSSSYLNPNIHFNEIANEKPLGPFYPEILLLVSHDMVIDDRYKLSNYDYPTKHVLYYLIYMNAVAMLFAKLAQYVVIHINIAGIIIEETKSKFPFSTSLYLDNQLICTNRDLVTHSITKYLNDLRNNDEEQLFPEDSFDFFFYSTIILARTDKEKKMLRGVSTDWFNIFEWRASLKKSKLQKKFLGSIIDSTDKFQTYVDTTREISHLMRIHDDHWTSHSIMRKCRLDHCEHYLKWSRNSIDNFKDYFSFTRYKNRCFLLNKPRSLNVYNIPRSYLSIEDQCRCYGYSSISQEPAVVKCKKRLRCQYVSRHISNSPPKQPRHMPYPLDGTPCDDHSVCWREQCIPGIIEMNDEPIELGDHKRKLNVVSAKPNIRI